MSTATGDTTSLFFALIRCGIGKEKILPHTPTREQWAALLDMSRKQTLAGIAFAGIETLPHEQRPPREVLLQWYSLCENIKKLNSSLNRKAVIVSQKFREEGFGNCILKGQGIASLYPNPLLRMPGDIDIWLDGGCDRVLRYINSITPDCDPTYHHVDFNISGDTGIEVHYRPTWMYSPLKNRRLQRYFARTASEQFGNTTLLAEGTLHVPTASFNRVYIPLHIYRHLFSEGIGLRQVLDYYFVLMQGFSKEEQEECIGLYNALGIRRFVQALMYVMQHIFHLDEEHTIIAPDRRHGEFLLDEIMTAGNFGQYDTRYATADEGYNLTRVRNTFKRMSTLASCYPSEVLCAPFFKLWHMAWRWMKRKEMKKWK
jgi:hypothetical protein